MFAELCLCIELVNKFDRFCLGLDSCQCDARCESGVGGYRERECVGYLVEVANCSNAFCRFWRRLLLRRRVLFPSGSAKSCLLDGRAVCRARLVGRRARRVVSHLDRVFRCKSILEVSDEIPLRIHGSCRHETFAAKPRKTQFTAVLILR